MYRSDPANYFILESQRTLAAFLEILPDKVYAVQVQCSLCVFEGLSALHHRSGSNWFHCICIALSIRIEPVPLEVVSNWLEAHYTCSCTHAQAHLHMTFKLHFLFAHACILIDGTLDETQALIVVRAHSGHSGGNKTPNIKIITASNSFCSRYCECVTCYACKTLDRGMSIARS